MLVLFIVHEPALGGAIDRRGCHRKSGSRWPRFAVGLALAAWRYKTRAPIAMTRLTCKPELFGDIHLITIQQ